MHYLYNMPYNSPCDVDIDVVLLQYHHRPKVPPLQKQHRIAVSSLVDMPLLQPRSTLFSMALHAVPLHSSVVSIQSVLVLSMLLR